jgi:histone-lysine N-methyltransferase SETMAR
MEISKHDIRKILYFQYKLGVNARMAVENICTVFGASTLTASTAYNWYKRFDEGDFSIEDKPRPGAPITTDLGRLQQLIEEDPKMTTQCIADALSVHYNTVDRNLRQMGLVPKLGVWVPHDLNDYNKKKRVEVCQQLKSMKRTFNWLDHLITGDEKWVMYVNHTRKRQWCAADQTPEPTPKPELHPKKVMISVWWDVAGVIHWELLPANTTVTATIYTAQLERVKAKYVERRPGAREVFFLHDNARPHVAMATKEKLTELGWTVLPHPPYSPDLAPTDYHLFLSLANSLSNRNFNDESGLKHYIQTFFDSKSPDFYSSGIRKLPIKWQEVINNNGSYVIKK